MFKSDNDREKFQSIYMERRHRAAIREGKIDALCVTSCTASLGTSVGGKIETLKIPERMFDERNAVIAWKKFKPPLNVQKHSSRDGIPMTSCLLALVKTVKESGHKYSTRLDTCCDKGKLPKKRLKLFVSEK